MVANHPSDPRDAKAPRADGPTPVRAWLQPREHGLTEGDWRERGPQPWGMTVERRSDNPFFAGEFDELVAVGPRARRAAVLHLVAVMADVPACGG